MNPTLVVEYATEGSPMLIADAKSAVHWRGGDDDGSGVVVEYMGEKVETLPRELLQTAKPGRQMKKFADLAEARAFESKLLAALHKLHPDAARHPRYPDQPAYYRGAERVYSVEIKFTSMLDAVLKSLKSDVQVAVFDKKRKAQGIFVQQEGGRGLIVADAKALVVARFHYQAPEDKDTAMTELLSLEAPRSKTKVALDGRLFVFESALSERDVATVNWQRPSLAEAIGPAFDGKEGGPLRAADQQLAAGAFVRLPAGEYALSYDDDADAAGGASVVWLVRL
jgi:hypothetical protein